MGKCDAKSGPLVPLLPVVGAGSKWGWGVGAVMVGGASFSVGHSECTKEFNVGHCRVIVWAFWTTIDGVPEMDLI